MRDDLSRRSATVARRRARGGLAALLAAATLVACQSKPPEEDLLKKVQPVGSWLATLEMLGQKWAANSVPASFVKTTTSAARDQFTKAAEEAAKSPARPAVRDPLRQLATEAGAASEGLWRAVEANDRSAVAREVGRLAGLKARFEALRKASGGSS
jgi:hypothetical protein